MSEARFTAKELAQWSSGQWLGCRAGEENRSFGISTDTRSDGKGKIFFALTGESFDAHAFLSQALDSGCEALCIARSKQDHLPQGCSVPVLLVDDPLKSMQALAAMHRRRFPALKIAAVTGSVGKTSVKEMLRAIFTEEVGEDKVLYTIGNTNNGFGVPQNLFRLNENHRFAVIEMGTSSPGEIQPLSQMAQPDVAVVNTIAACHLEKLIDFNGVAREKGSIFTGLRAGGSAVIPAVCPAQEVLEAAAAGHPVLRFGAAGAAGFSARYEGGDLTQSRFALTFPGGKCFSVTWALTGAHQAVNAAAAAAAAWSLGIAPEVIAAGLSHTVLPGMRMKTTTLAGVTYINDAYNANPASMRAMIELLSRSVDSAKIVLILGGMRELGENSAEEHRRLLALVQKELPQARVVTIGPEFAPDAPNHFDRSADAESFVASLVHEGDTVFAKGSRGNRVESALPQEAR